LAQPKRALAVQTRQVMRKHRDKVRLAVHALTLLQGNGIRGRWLADYHGDCIKKVNPISDFCFPL
jgi:hypothetical protein